MAHDRKLVIGAVALVNVRIRHLHDVVPQIRDKCERAVISAGWFPNAQFRWVGLVLRWGDETALAPEFEPVNKQHGDLPVSMQVEARKLKECDHDKDVLSQVLTEHVVTCLLAIADRYSLPRGPLDELLHVER